MRAALLILLVLSLLVIPGCMMNERLSGTVMGGVGGGVIGAVAGGVGGAVIGLLAGGLAGYLVGDYVADQRERGRGSVFGNDCCPPQQAPACCPPTSQAQPYQPYEQPPGFAPQGAVAGIKERAPAPAVVNGRRTNPQAAKAAYDRGKAALTAPEARVHFEESIRLDPTRPEPYNALALNALYRGDHSDADRYFRKALAADPSYRPARYNYERFQRQHGR